MTRYNQLLELIDQYKPRTICEIGVWNGQNAIRMINRAKQYHADVEYTGYDLFEDATTETDAVEFNVKGHNQMRAVAAEIRAATGVVPHLVRGNTRETLPKDTIADFVFLDGGHSVETIESDYSRVKDSKTVVLDDYYTKDENGNCPDIEKYGCNFLLVQTVSNVSEQTYRYYFNSDPKLKWEIATQRDPVKGGGYTQLVVVTNV